MREWGRDSGCFSGFYSFLIFLAIAGAVLSSTAHAVSGKKGARGEACALPEKGDPMLAKGHACILYSNYGARRILSRVGSLANARMAA